MSSIKSQEQFALTISSEKVYHSHKIILQFKKYMLVHCQATGLTFN